MKILCSRQSYAIKTAMVKAQLLFEAACYVILGSFSFFPKSGSVRDNIVEDFGKKLEIPNIWWNFALG